MRFGKLDAKNIQNVYENIVIGLEIAFLSGLEAEIRILPVWAAAIFDFDIRLQLEVF